MCFSQTILSKFHFLTPDPHFPIPLPAPRPPHIMKFGPPKNCLYKLVLSKFVCQISKTFKAKCVSGYSDKNLGKTIFWTKIVFCEI